MIYQSQAQLDEAVTYWKDLLGLRDWTVKATLSRRHELEGDNQGECQVSEEHRTIRVWILAEQDFSPDAIVPYDQEHTLVHELLHAWTRSMEPDEPDRHSEMVEEQAINALSDGFVRLKRSAS